MIINDRIYGKHQITQSVLKELILSPALQRLKGISQYGLPDEYYSLPGFSRFEHSVGVAILLDKLGAGLEEQIAGLLHDASHTAFSHVIDWVLGDSIIENYQDKNHLLLLKQSGIKTILSKYGYTVNRMARFELFPLLERNTPDLCADRLDYSLREFQLWAQPEIVDSCIKDLTVAAERIVFKHAKIAKKYAIAYSKCQNEHWGGLEAVSRYHRLAEALKLALKLKILKQSDFRFDDQYVLQKLYQSKNQPIIKILEGLHNKTTFIRLGIIRQKKFRSIDPHILHYNRPEKLSVIDPEYAKFLKQHKQHNLKGVAI